MIGHSIIELDSVDSTSNYIAKALETGNYRWGTAIMAHFQTNGRGQRATSWQSEGGKNLTFSFALPLNDFDSRAYFSISRAISLGISRTIRCLVEADVRIKWPNDILANQKKIAGVLIETKSGENQAAVCGIGLNVNQTAFPNLPHVGSLKLLSGKAFDVRKVLDQLLENLNSEWEMLHQGDFRNQQSRYESELYGLNKSHSFEENGSIFQGEITGTTADGRLRILSKGVEIACQPKSIKILY